MKKQIILILFAAAIAAANATAQTITSSVVASGATTAENSTLRIQGTVGQAVIGTTMSATNANAQGFWHNGTSNASSVAQPADALLADFTLDQNYPNPFGALSQMTTIRFTAPRSAQVTLNIYSMTGALVKTLLSGNVTPGNYTIALDAATLPTGAYLYALESEGHAITKQLTIIR